MINIIEFFKANWGILIQGFIAIVNIIVMYYIYYKVQSKEKKKEEKKFREDIRERLPKIETKIEMLTQLYPQLKSLEKLENFDKLKLSEKDIKETVSEVLKTTNITPEALDARIEEKIEKKFSDFDKGIATIVAQKLNEIDKRFKKPIGDAFDYLILGNSEHDKGNYSKSMEYYNKAIEIKPDDAIAWYNKGVTLSKLGRYEEALKAYDKAIEIKPDDAAAWSNKSHALVNLGRYDEAHKVYDKLIEIKPDYANAWYNKACAYSLKGDKVSALKNLSKATELDAKFKEMAKKDEDFKNFWNDDDFKKIVS